MVHAHVQILGLQGNLVVCSSLVDMYGKCNDVDGARMVFNSMGCRNVVSWTAMIAGCAQNGKGYEALEVFREFSGYMTERPNHFMLASVINACASLGRLVSGKVTHGAVIRGGVSPNEGALLWGTLLSSSRLQGRVDIAVEASKWLIESNQQVAGAYVTLSNTYTLAGEWEKAHSLRAEMDLVGVHKEPGCSWIEIKDSIYVFYAGDLSCERRDEVISLLRELERRMVERGYVGGTIRAAAVHWLV
ncbi:hypothetical protein OIU84_021882 [Salix udensis]|uniref:Pentatricopeptide repeat-containing protein n=1 Tax=Salix udensis TaxID=889485 RepID=A0AAD6PI28_9ROSI|nr:hypothetical protein OIU84_021882 [Salix udensis]